MIAQVRSQPNFAPGQLVRHRRYGYRGVVVACDTTCQAPDSWYLSNQTQPDRQQPWYHVLVDGTQTATYAAQDNLLPETDARPIRHPLTSKFFDIFSGGSYMRNDRPWTGC